MHFNCQVRCKGAAFVRLYVEYNEITCEKQLFCPIFCFFKRLLAQIAKTTKYYFVSFEHKLGNSLILTLGHIRIFLTFVAITWKVRRNFWKFVKILHALIFKASLGHVFVVSRGSFFPNWAFLRTGYRMLKTIWLRIIPKCAAAVFLLAMRTVTHSAFSHSFLSLSSTLWCSAFYGSSAHCEGFTLKHRQ